MSSIGCDLDGAVRYLGCSRSMFLQLRGKRIVKSIRKGWYLYVDLDAAAEELRRRRDKELKIGEDDNEETDSARKEIKTGTMGSEGRRHVYRKTEELLRQHSGGGK